MNYVEDTATALVLGVLVAAYVAAGALAVRTGIRRWRKHRRNWTDPRV